MGKRILAIDDSKTIRNMVSSALKGSGYEVFEAEDGQQALDILKDSDKMDLIITDINMPVMNGYDLIKKLRADSKYAKTPILVLSTEGDDIAKERGKEAGATGWVTKPFNPEKMLYIIEKVCR